MYHPVMENVVTYLWDDFVGGLVVTYYVIKSFFE